MIDLNLVEPDGFNGKKIDPTIVFGQLFALLSIWNASLSNRGVMVCSTIIDPYKNSVLRFLVRCILNNVSLITPRKEFSRDHLESIEVKRPEIQVAADLAFLMESDDDVNCTRVSKVLDVGAGSNAFVGICPPANHWSLLHRALSHLLFVTFYPSVMISLNLPRARSCSQTICQSAARQLFLIKDTKYIINVGRNYAGSQQFFCETLPRISCKLEYFLNSR